MSDANHDALARIILGTMTIGGQTNSEDALTMVQDFVTNSKWSAAVVGSNHEPMVDTAIMYQGGKTEEILGNILKTSISCSLATKANPFTPDKNMSRVGIRQQLEASHESLGVNCVDLFYLHAPDVHHPIEETLEEVQAMHKEGMFARFGLSNFTAWETVYIYSYMSNRDGYIVPTVYQGMYNAITRSVETDLFPALRKCGMQFYAYNPLAGGMLSGKHSTATTTMTDGRFSGNTFWAKRYRERYQQPKQFEAVQMVQDALLENEHMADVSLRWLRQCSHLAQDDGIIVGASKLSYYHANMESLAHGESLPPRLVKALNDAWRHCQDSCPDYARGYSGSKVSS